MAAIAIGALVGAAIDLGFQAYENYSKGEEVLDINNYNFAETFIIAAGSALTVAVPYGAPLVAAELGISTGAVSVLGYGMIGGVVNAAVEIETNPNPTKGSIALESVKGIASSVAAAGFGNLISKIPAVQRIANSISHSKSAITPTAGRIITGLAPTGWYLSFIDQETSKLFAIDQVSGAFFTITWEEIMREVEELYTETEEENKE